MKRFVTAMTEVENPNKKNIVTRLIVIEVLGVTYAHSGSWESPIIELPGRRIIDTDVLSERYLFETEDQAIEHVKRMARAAAESRAEAFETMFSSKRIKLRLWLARNWLWFRKKERGLLATYDIHMGHKKKYEKVLSPRYIPKIKRMPERIRVPAIFEVDTPIWVIDYSKFPEQPASIVEDKIRMIEYSDPQPGEDLDIKPRYYLTFNNNVFTYNNLDVEMDEMNSASPKVKAFIRQEAAIIHLQDTIQKTKETLEKTLTMIPHKNDNTILRIEDRTEEE